MIYSGPCGPISRSNKLTSVHAFAAVPPKRIQYAALRLFDLAGADHRRFSPFCWRTKLALAHKGLVVDTVPWRFTDKDALAFSGQGRVPVLVDGDTPVVDSWAIAVHLETNYPERPSLFGGEVGMSVTRFVNAWTDKVLHPALAPLVISDIHAHVAQQDRKYSHHPRKGFW